MQHIFIIDYCSLFFASLFGCPWWLSQEGLGQEEKGTTEDEMAGWHHWLYGRESAWTPGVGDGQEGLACCDWFMRSQRVGHNWATELNWTDGLEWIRKDTGFLLGVTRKLSNLQVCSLYFSLDLCVLGFTWHLLWATVASYLAAKTGEKVVGYN